MVYSMYVSSFLSCLLSLRFGTRIFGIGLNIFLQYAPLLFQQAGLSTSKASFLASGVSAILIFVTTIPAVLLSDRVGRRASTIYGGFILSASMALIGSLYASESVHESYGAGRWVVVVMIYLFTVCYCMSKPVVKLLQSFGPSLTSPFQAWAVGVKVFASEIQPVATRATATSLAQSANCVSFPVFPKLFPTSVSPRHISMMSY